MVTSGKLGAFLVFYAFAEGNVDARGSGRREIDESDGGRTHGGEGEGRQNPLTTTTIQEAGSRQR